MRPPRATRWGGRRPVRHLAWLILAALVALPLSAGGARRHPVPAGSHAPGASVLSGPALGPDVTLTSCGGGVFPTARRAGWAGSGRVVVGGAREGREGNSGGANEHGQIGDGTTMQRDSPVAVTLPGSVPATAIAAGFGHGLALGRNGTLYAWGANEHGQLGDGTTTDRYTPMAVTLPSSVLATAVAAGYQHSLALARNGTLYAWGYNTDGQLGDGTTEERDSPVPVTLPM